MIILWLLEKHTLTKLSAGDGTDAAEAKPKTKRKRSSAKSKTEEHPAQADDVANIEEKDRK